ncbi:MAG: molybdopterin molybdotransferase MoeA [Caulobacterales bacterium]|nr:molybdopterin molybdotransferase MoeA [Caulobacterales bacterium]
MISLDEGLSRLLAQARPLGDEPVGLEAAYGRVLAAPLSARGDAPQAAVSAMDGYAVFDADLATTPARLPIAARIFAGAADPAPLEPGTCARIFTGAPVPPGADRVVIQEQVRPDGDAAVFEAAPGAARHIRAAGSDFKVGDVLLEPGRRLDARALVAAAAADRDHLSVYRRPRVVILGTGDELAEPGRALETPGAIPESVSFGVMGLAWAWGGQVIGRRRLPDEPAALEVAARQALDDADVVVVTGGASVGERDFAKSMFPDGALDLIFAKVAIKPGKPVWFARAGARLVLGLPGNPTSAMVTGRLFLAPLLAGLSGRDPVEALAWREAVLGAPLKPAGDRETLERGRILNGRVQALSDQDSGAQRALAAADVLIRRYPSSPAAEVGEIVSVLDF